LAEWLLKNNPFTITEVRLLPAKGGRFEVTVDGTLIYSKLATGRHAHPGEIEGLFAALQP
jgi:selenoprotein W-related protein